MAYTSDGTQNYQDIVKSMRDNMVTLILDSIEKNPTEWESGWTAIDATTPINGRTNRAYNGFNSLYLYFLAKKRGYKDSRWVTFNQAKELGASVKKGEKSSPVLFYQLYDKNTKKEFNSLTVRDLSDEEKKQYMQDNVRRVLKYSTVFNAEQCDRFPERTDELPKMTEEERTRQNVMIEQIINNSAAPIYYDGGNRAYYSPGSDSIHLPKIDAFHTMQDFYATALHEIAHSTGHESRLNRFGAFGSEDSYAAEELRAELASVFMQRELGITLEGRHFENHAAYLNSWLNAVRNDKRLFFDAVRDAEKISDYVAEHYLDADRSAELDARANVAADENTKEKSALATRYAILDATMKVAREDMSHVDAQYTDSFVEGYFIEYLRLEKQVKNNGVAASLEPDLIRSAIDEFSKPLTAPMYGWDKSAIERTIVQRISDPAMREQATKLIYHSDSALDAEQTAAQENGEHKEEISREEYEESQRRIVEEDNARNFGLGSETQVELSPLAKLRAQAEEYVKSTGKPHVLIEWSESKDVPDETIMTFEAADRMLRDLNSIHSDMGYYKTKLHIFYQDQESDEVSTYNELRFDIGTERAGLVEHIEDYAQDASAIAAGFTNAEEQRERLRFVNILKEYMQTIDTKESASDADSEQTQARENGEHKEENHHAATNTFCTDFGGDYQFFLVDDGLSIEDVCSAYALDPYSGFGYRFGQHISYEQYKEIQERGNGFNINFLDDLNSYTITQNGKVIDDGYLEDLVQKYQERDAELNARADVASDANEAAQKPKETLGEELAGKTTWLKIELPKDAIGGKFGKNTLVRMPEGEYAHFGLFVDSKYLKKNTEEKWTLTVGDKHNYRITNDGRRVELNGKELKDVLSGKELGRTPERYAASKRNKEALDRLAKNIPDELKALPCWGVYFTTPPKDPKKTKRDKVILSPTDGHWARANDPSAWTDFDTAMKYALATDKEGLSLLLTEESRKSGITCIDLDESIDAEGKYNGIASKLTEELKGTYMERSVSGNGLHIFVKDDVLKEGKYKSAVKTPNGDLEVYDSAHIISLTGDMVSKTNEITKCPTATTLFLREQLGERQVANVASSAPTNANRGEYRPGTDNEVIERIRKSKKGAEFDALYSGKGVTGNASMDDMKLAGILAFFTDCDEAQCFRIMRSSASYRPDKSDNYYLHTIGKAINNLYSRPTLGATAGAEVSKDPNKPKDPNGRGKD